MLKAIYYAIAKLADPISRVILPMTNYLSLHYSFFIYCKVRRDSIKRIDIGIC